ncbi:WEB family protein At4g27595, chloroplastic-like [Impatiens glandulifera]|uniref:WEB family protein At4g27595, chloroplastic-like n=1 Tax=Impatiens glandulifera TaxID=253017 RepID=UPI001FB08D0F|nr:WEB family protein At4g27595, chloroplastic-like [Impatiens glandulifera]
MTSSEKVSALVGLKRTCVSKIKLINLAWNDLEENLDYSEKAFDEAIIDLRTREAGLNKTRKSIEESKEEVELLRKSVDSRLDKLLQREKQADDLDLKERVLNDRFKRLDEIQKLHEESGEANKIRGKELDSLEASFNRSLKEFHLKEKYFKLDKEMLDLQMKELGLKQEELEEKLKEIDKTRESVEHHAKEVEMERNRLHEQRRDLELKEQQLTSHNIKPLMERVSNLLQKKAGDNKRPGSFLDSNPEAHRVKKDCSDVSIHETSNEIVAITVSNNSSDKSGRHLVSTFDIVRRSLVLNNGDEIRIDEEDVQCVLNIPRGEIEIVESNGNDSKDLVYNDFLKNWRRRWGLHQNKGAPESNAMPFESEGGGFGRGRGVARLPLLEEDHPEIPDQDHPEIPDQDLGEAQH